MSDSDFADLSTVNSMFYVYVKVTQHGTLELKCDCKTSVYTAKNALI